MRWGRPKFALFAVIAVSAGVLSGAPTPARAQTGPAETDTVLLWRDQGGQPSGDTKFYVSVRKNEGTARPTGNVVVTFDGVAQAALDLGAPRPDPDDERASITPDVTLKLGFGPHYFTTHYEGTDAFEESDDELGLANGRLEVSPEPSQEGTDPTYVFTLVISDKTPTNRRPHGRVAFSDDDGHSTASQSSATSHPQIGNDLRAVWRIAQRPGRWTATADYLPSDDGTDFFLPISASRAHQVNPRPGQTVPATTTTRRTTPTTRRPTVTTRRNGTAAPLAPINPSSTTTPLQESSTTVTFGSFPTAPRPSGELAANENDDEGPPLAVVVTTLLALGVLGGIAAFRRYRHSAVDWF